MQRYKVIFRGISCKKKLRFSAKSLKLITASYSYTAACVKLKTANYKPRITELAEKMQ